MLVLTAINATLIQLSAYIANIMSFMNRVWPHKIALLRLAELLHYNYMAIVGAKMM